MDREKAAAIITAWMQEHGELDGYDRVLRPERIYNVSGYISWWKGQRAILDGEFTPEVLEAIAWWMREAEKI